MKSPDGIWIIACECLRLDITSGLSSYRPSSTIYSHIIETSIPTSEYIMASAAKRKIVVAGGNGFLGT